MKTAAWFGSRLVLAAFFWWMDWRAALWFLCGYTLCEVGWWHEQGLRKRAEDQLKHAELAAQTLRLELAVTNFRQLVTAEKFSAINRQAEDLMNVFKATKDRRLRDRVTSKVLTMVKSKQVH